MIDPFYKNIVDRLGWQLDPQAFQRCARELLRNIFPGIAPVGGGADGGMDAAIPDGIEEAFSLVATTDKAVARNLRQNLASLKRDGKPPRVILATSRALTPKNRRDLEKCAREEGFTLIQIFDREGIAELIYRNPRCCKELLGLTGEPPALTAVPRSRRPLLDLPLLGREADIEWLRSTSGDRVVTGQPGSGKTFLLLHLVRQGCGLFLRPEASDGEIANALREQQPKVVIVDDAHVDPRTLDRLRHVRADLGASFDIVATTWQGDLDQVKEALGGVAPDRVRKLEGLTRQEILEIYHTAGVDADDAWMRDLVDQAANRPGLAVTLATLWLQGAYREVLGGQALSQTLLTAFRHLVGPEATDLLAGFALGGARGMGLDAVAQFLGLPRAEVRRKAAGLASGGVLTQTPEDTLAVWPRALRAAALGLVFFPPSGPNLDYRPLLAQAPSRDSAVQAILEAAQRGVSVPRSDLRGLVAQSQRSEVWGGFALLGEGEARWVLEKYKGDVLDIGREILEQAPEAAIPRLLQRAVQEESAQRESRGLGILSAWVEDVEVRPYPEWIQRRRQVAKEAKKMVLSGHGSEVAIEAIFRMLSPALRGSSTDPGLGNTVTYKHALLPRPYLGGIATIWGEVRDAITALNSLPWQHLSAALWNWMYPSYAAKAEVPKETEEVMHRFAGNILRDLTPLAAGSPGLAAGLQRLASRIDVTLELDHDPVFEILCPPEPVDLEARETDSAARKGKLTDLAVTWATEKPEAIARRLKFYEAEAKRIGVTYTTSETLHLCRQLAEGAAEPARWLDVFLDTDAPIPLINVFLEHIVKKQSPGWEGRVERCLRLDAHGWFAMSLVLALPVPPGGLLEQALACAGQAYGIVETQCLRKEVPTATLLRLLRHTHWRTALAAAVGEWCSDPRGVVQAAVVEDWRKAMVGAKADGSVGSFSWLQEILANDAELAAEWLQAHLTEFGLSESKPFAAAVGALTFEQRIALLEQVDASARPFWLVRKIVGNDPKLYQRLLNLKQLRSYYLVPLQGLPNDAWVSMAALALDAGYSPQDVAAAAYATNHGYAASGLDYWQEWDRAFAAFEDHPRQDMREVAKHGRAEAASLIEEARKEEREVQLRGFV